MRALILSLALVGAFASAGCQSNEARPATTTDTGETPSNGLVPGQVPD